MMSDGKFFYNRFTFNQQAQLAFLKLPSLLFDRNGSCSSDCHYLLGRSPGSKGNKWIKHRLCSESPNVYGL